MIENKSDNTYYKQGIETGKGFKLQEQNQKQEQEQKQESRQQRSISIILSLIFFYILLVCIIKISNKTIITAGIVALFLLIGAMYYKSYKSISKQKRKSILKEDIKFVVAILCFIVSVIFAFAFSVILYESVNKLIYVKRVKIVYLFLLITILLLVYSLIYLVHDFFNQFRKIKIKLKTKNAGKILSLFVATATIVSAVPVALGWISKVIEKLNLVL